MSTLHQNSVFGSTTTGLLLILLLLLCVGQRVARGQFLNDVGSRRDLIDTANDGQFISQSPNGTVTDIGLGSSNVDAETLLQEKLEQIKKLQMQQVRIETPTQRETQKPLYTYQPPYQTSAQPSVVELTSAASIIRSAQNKHIAQLIESIRSPLPQELKLKEFQPNSPTQVISAPPLGATAPASQRSAQQQQQQQQQQPQQLQAYSNYNQLYLGHNPFIEILRPLSYADDNIVTLNLSHSHIYEIDSEAFVGQRFEYIDLSNNKLGLIHSRSFRIGPSHSRHTPYNPTSSSGSATTNATNKITQNSNNSNNNNNNTSSGSKSLMAVYPNRRPPPTNPKSVTIDFSHNPAIVALSGAFDHIDVPNCLLNFTNSTVELKFGAFKKYFKEHPGHIVDVESVDCCEQEWLLGYKHNFVSRTHCEHDPSLYLSKVSQQTIIDSCIAYVTSARHSMTIQGPSIIHQVAAHPGGLRGHHSGHHSDSNQYLTYLILGGTAMVLTSLSIYIIFYMFSLKAAFVYQMQNKS